MWDVTRTSPQPPHNPHTTLALSVVPLSARHQRGRGIYSSLSVAAPMTRVIAAAVACLLLDLVAAQFPYRAIARMRGATAAGSAVAGTVTFEQQAPLSPVTVSVQISGLRPGTHGFHVHQFGDVRVTANLDTISAHFVPQCAPPDVDENGQQVGGCENDQVHGLPPSLTRQPGDMGNIEVGYDGLVTPASRSLIIGESKMSLADPLRSIIGRTVVVHAERDDGLPPYGNAGGPEAYGVIGLASTPVGTSNSALAPTVPHVTKVICTFEGASTVGGQANNVGSVSGSALLHLLEPHQPGVVRMQARLLGLQRDSTHSFHFHEWGDMTVGLTGSGMGPIYAENAIVVDKVKVNSQGYGLFDEEFRTDSLLQHVRARRASRAHEDTTRPPVAFCCAWRGRWVVL